VGGFLAFEVVLGRPDIGVAHEFLDVIELIAGLYQAVSESGAEGVGGGAFGNSGGAVGEFLFWHSGFSLDFPVS